MYKKKLNLPKEFDSKIVYHENLVQILEFLLSSNYNNTDSLRFPSAQLKLKRTFKRLQL